MKINFAKHKKLTQDEKLNLVIESILNKFDIAFAYYEEQLKQYPELEGLIEF